MNSNAAQPDVQSQTIGIIGLGLMGSVLVQRLIGEGLCVVGYDIDESKADALKALTKFDCAKDAKAVFAIADDIILCLPSHEQVAEVIQENEFSIRPNSCLIDVTTGKPESARSLSRKLQASKIDYVDATISGSSAQLERGEIIWMVGGAEGSVHRVRPILEPLGQRFFHIGPSGQGSVMKLVTNLVLGLNRAAIAEGLSFAEMHELDLQLTIEVLRSSAAYSRMMDTKADKMIERDYQPQARLAQHQKDVRLILEECSDHDITLPLSVAHNEILNKAIEQGLGELDNSALIEVLRPRSKE